MGDDWSIYNKCLGRLGVYLQETGDDANAETSLIFCLKGIVLDSGSTFVDDGNAKKFQLLTPEQLQLHSSEFRDRYVDLVMRLSLVKGEIGDVENAWKLSQYSLNLPMDQGSRVLKSRIMRLAAKLEANKGHDDRAESYLLDSIKFNEYHEDSIKFISHGSLTLSKDSNITSELFHSLLDLGVLYTKQKQYTKSLEIFLNLLQLTEAPAPPSWIQNADRPLLKNYIGEILYTQCMTQDAIKWCREAFKGARVDSRFDQRSASVTSQALRNLIKLYKQVGDEELQQQAQKALDDCVIPVKVNRQWALLEKMLS